ncbi:hypothetical protein [Bathymodiolus platifrons methanotrophic gill symbiont]|uniref:hypothetical protein n=2 Tax=Bathymodiolus platifrons methanotrophic gill symbiont TaxID=113268 RepID=UPI000B418951|nr:hypothetical protein [Bathymodiolus platifrons methanotrophic gill symbiont]
MGEISQSMGRYKSTISPELKRNTGKCGYRYKQAQSMATQRHIDKSKAIKLPADLGQIITPLLKQ